MPLQIGITTKPNHVPDNVTEVDVVSKLSKVSTSFNIVDNTL